MNFEAHVPKKMSKHTESDPMVVTITAENASDHTCLLSLMNAVAVPGLINEMFNLVVKGVFSAMADKDKGSPEQLQ